MRNLNLILFSSKLELAKPFDELFHRFLVQCAQRLVAMRPEIGECRVHLFNLHLTHPKNIRPSHYETLWYSILNKYYKGKELLDGRVMCGMGYDEEDRHYFCVQAYEDYVKNFNMQGTLFEECGPLPFESFPQEFHNGESIKTLS